jgi:hypothetical protein
MKHLKNFKLFESGESVKLTPAMIKLADSMMVEITIVVETDKDKMDEWVIEEAYQRVNDEYLDSDEFRKFTEASVEETDEYRVRIEEGGDPQEVLEDLTDDAIKRKTYWDKFVEDYGYDTDEMDKVYGEIPYINPGKEEYLLGVDSTWKEIPGTSFPTIDIEGSAVIHKYEGSFLPFRIRDVTSGILFPDDIIQDFQTAYQESFSGELSIYNTRLIALDKPTDVEYSFDISDNSRLISIEGLREYEEINIDGNFLDEKILKKSINLIPGTEESVEYYLSLLDLPEADRFDEEQLEFVISRIGDLQNVINQNPEKMAIRLKSIWKKLKSIENYKDLEFPKEISREADLLSDLDAIGL